MAALVNRQRCRVACYGELTTGDGEGFVACRNCTSDLVLHWADAALCLSVGRRRVDVLCGIGARDAVLS